MDNYPKTDFAMDSKYKLDLIYERLAGKEMFIGNHYLKKRQIKVNVRIKKLTIFKNKIEVFLLY